MRPPREYLFRLRQEITNLALWLRPPNLPSSTATPAPLKLPHLSASEPSLVESILQHKFPLLGLIIETGPTIHWRRDYISGIETPPIYFRRIKYLDPLRTGDHKVIWELNRHQHLVVLAHAGQLEELFRQWDSWVTDNPYQCGINWTSALEVAFRALSWIWVYHLVGERMDATRRHRFLTELYRHGRLIEANLSFYFSPNTHLLGEAVALHALGVLFPQFPSRWATRGAAILREELTRQIRPDGSHFEQSSYYHLYALDLYKFHAALGGDCREAIERMEEYLRALLMPDGSLPFLGDDDGGRLFHAYGDRAHFANLEPSAHSRRFENSGIISLATADKKILFDTGPFGPGRSGHSHSDTLSVVVSSGRENLLVDAGTFTYSDPVWRDRFRGSAAHNTVRMDGLDQATPAGPFAWKDPPRVVLHHFSTSDELDRADASCHYAGFEHRRRLIWIKPNLLLIVDEVTGQTIEQFWHPGVPVELLDPQHFRLGECVTLSLSTPAQIEPSWQSPIFAVRQESRTIVAKLIGESPLRIAAALDWSGAAEDLALIGPEIHYGHRTWKI